MARKRTIRNYPTSGWVVRLLKQDIEDLGIEDGDEIDLEDVVIHKTKKGDKGK